MTTGRFTTENTEISPGFQTEEQKNRLCLTACGIFRTVYVPGSSVRKSTYSKQDEYFIRNIAKKFDLLPSGGSDFHGTNKPHISLGSGMGHLAVPYEYLQQMKEYAARS